MKEMQFWIVNIFILRLTPVLRLTRLSRFRSFPICQEKTLILIRPLQKFPKACRHLHSSSEWFLHGNSQGLRLKMLVNNCTMLFDYSRIDTTVFQVFHFAQKTFLLPKSLSTLLVQLHAGYSTRPVACRFRVSPFPLQIVLKIKNCSVSALENVSGKHSLCRQY